MGRMRKGWSADDWWKQATSLLLSRYGIEPSDVGLERSRVSSLGRLETAEEYVDRIREKYDLEEIAPTCW